MVVVRTGHSTGRIRARGRRFGWLLSWLMLGCAKPSTTPLDVFAAASLTDAFAELERDFEADHPGVDVRLSTAGSQILRIQIEHGAPADIFASASAAHMRALVEADRVEDSRVFARGELVLVVPPDNPAGIESLEHLPRASRIVLGDPEVPVGHYTRALLDRAAARYGPDFRARVEEHVVSLEPSVRSVLAKVELGEADAALVYRSDVTHARAVRAIDIPADFGVTAEYHVGIPTRSPHRALARAWLTDLESPTGRATLERHGLLRP